MRAALGPHRAGVVHSGPFLACHFRSLLFGDLTPSQMAAANGAGDKPLATGFAVVTVVEK